MDDRTFETRAGIYTYAMDNHGGQSSRLYRLISRIQFNASDCAFREIQTGIAHRISRRTNRPAMRWRVKCDGCEMVAINGLPCHERGCPNARTGKGLGKVRYIAVPTEEWEHAHEVYRGLTERKAQ